MMVSARSFVPVLAIAAMLLRGLVPVGWMPAHDMRAPVMICPMHMHAAPARHGTPPRCTVCPFTALAQLAMAGVAPPEVLSTNAVAFSHEPNPIAAFLFVSTFHRSQSPRAPPTLA